MLNPSNSISVLSMYSSHVLVSLKSRTGYISKHRIQEENINEFNKHDKCYNQNILCEKKCVFTISSF